MEALGRYQKLGLSEALTRIGNYPFACTELSCILRAAYNKVPKTLQSLLFHDTLAAFRLLTQMPTSRGVAAANLLLHAAEATLPKQKKTLAVTEFKNAIIAHKRRCKPLKDEEGSATLPQDVLGHIFSLLDMRSLVAASLVCWSWSLTASDNMLWQSQYIQYFGNSEILDKNEPIGQAYGELVDANLCKVNECEATSFNLGWKEAFKRKYIGNPLWKSISNRGYCVQCKSIIWLDDAACAKSHHNTNVKNKKREIKPVSPYQVVGYLLGDSLVMSSSDSDSDSDEAQWKEQQFPKLWAFPKRVLYK